MVCKGGDPKPWWSKADFSWQAQEIGAFYFIVQTSWEAQRFVNLEVQ